MELPDWLQAWQVWLGLGITLGVAEMMSLDLVLLMLAVGALVGMTAAVIGVPFAFQILAAVGASVAMLALVRPSIVKRFHAGPDLKLGHETLVGKQALAIEEITTQGGLIKIGGETWTARPFDESLVIAPGATVDIFEIRGATAYVHEVPSLDP